MTMKITMNYSKRAAFLLLIGEKPALGNVELG